MKLCISLFDAILKIYISVTRYLSWQSGWSVNTHRMCKDHKKKYFTKLWLSEKRWSGNWKFIGKSENIFVKYLKKIILWSKSIQHEFIRDYSNCWWVLSSQLHHSNHLRDCSSLVVTRNLMTRNIFNFCQVFTNAKLMLNESIRLRLRLTSKRL